MKINWTEISDIDALPEAPAVSVHMLAYNHGRYLTDAIESVICQDLDFPIELVIGEDCSADDTRQIALNYQKRLPHLIRVVFPDRNVGMYRNFERVTRTCRGKYVAFCEGDDYWVEPKKLMLQVEFLESHPEYGAVHGDINHLVHSFGARRLKRAIQKSCGERTPRGDVYDKLLHRMFIHTCTICCRGALLRDYLASNFNNPDYLVVDWPVMLFISRQSKVGYIDRVLGTYRRASGSAMNSGAANAVHRVLNAREIYSDFFAEYGATPEQRTAIDNILYRDLFYSALDARDLVHIAEARDWLAKNDPKFRQSYGKKLKELTTFFPILFKILMKLIFLRNEILTVFTHRRITSLY
jgi:glycosyltransferase involved in cell wall biosynthesis